MATPARCIAVLLGIIGLQLVGRAATAIELTIDPSQSIVVVEMVALGGCEGCAVDSLAFSGTMEANVSLSDDPTEGTGRGRPGRIGHLPGGSLAGLVHR